MALPIARGYPANLIGHHDLCISANHQILSLDIDPPSHFIHHNVEEGVLQALSQYPNARVTK